MQEIETNHLHLNSKNEIQNIKKKKKCTKHLKKVLHQYMWCMGGINNGYRLHNLTTTHEQKLKLIKL
jgi:hypothetical protein